MVIFQPYTTLMYAARNFLYMHTSLSVTVFVLVATVLGSCWFNPVSWHQVGVRGPSHERSPYREAVWLSAQKLIQNSVKASKLFRRLPPNQKPLLFQNVYLYVSIKLAHHPYLVYLFNTYLYTVSKTRIINGAESWIGCSLISWTFKDEGQTAVFKDPVRTAL